jgi:hypothetical protein
MGYTAGRFVIESLRSDPANHILGMRVNNWVAIIAFVGGLALFLHQRGKERSSAAPPDGLDTDGAVTESRATEEAELGGPDSESDLAGDLASKHVDDSGPAPSDR